MDIDQALLWLRYRAIPEVLQGFLYGYLREIDDPQNGGEWKGRHSMRVYGSAADIGIEELIVDVTIVMKADTLKTTITFLRAKNKDVLLMDILTIPKVPDFNVVLALTNQLYAYAMNKDLRESLDISYEVITDVMYDPDNYFTKEPLDKD